MRNMIQILQAVPPTPTNLSPTGEQSDSLKSLAQGWLAGSLNVQRTAGSGSLNAQRTAGSGSLNVL